MAKNEIDAVEMTRRIRDAHAEELKDKPASERIDYYRSKAESLFARLEQVVEDLLQCTNAA